MRYRILYRTECLIKYSIEDYTISVLTQENKYVTKSLFIDNNQHETVILSSNCGTTGKDNYSTTSLAWGASYFSLLFQQYNEDNSLNQTTMTVARATLCSTAY